MLSFVRVRQHSLALLICRGLIRYNFVKRRPGVILRHPHYAIYGENYGLVGWIGCTRRNGAVFEVRHLTVMPEARGRGIGKAAVEFMIAKIKENGAVYCYAVIHEDNAASQSLFLKCGFVLAREGYIRKYTKSLVEGL